MSSLLKFLFLHAEAKAPLLKFLLLITQVKNAGSSYVHPRSIVNANNIKIYNAQASYELCENIISANTNRYIPIYFASNNLPREEDVSMYV